jgi:hypothetical protein
VADVNPKLEAMIGSVAKALGSDLVRKTAFVGGVTTGLFITDEYAREQVRFTDDVDLIVGVMTHGKWVQLKQELHARGFNESSDDDVICRMRLNGLKVDFMPDDEKILGFSNRWYALGLETAVDHKLTDGTPIRILTPPLFLATKLEAFRGRGREDLLTSQDLEDILILLDGRKSLSDEIAAAPEEVRDYIRKEIAALTRYDQFENAVIGNMTSDTGRVELIYKRIKEIAADE